jgi:hypothetical protein
MTIVSSSLGAGSAGEQTLYLRYRICQHANQSTQHKYLNQRWISSDAHGGGEEANASF